MTGLSTCHFSQTSLLSPSSLHRKTQFDPCIPLFISSPAAGEAEPWVDLAYPVDADQWARKVQGCSLCPSLSTAMSLSPVYSDLLL